MNAIRKITVDYARRSEVAADAAGTRVTLALDASRGVVGLRGRVREPALVRDALATAFAILGSDLRYRRRDRAAYLAYLAKQGKKATKEIWEAQKAFLDESLDGEEQQEHVLDPVFTVDPDGASLEVFSRDESTYARLFLPNAIFDAREAAHGTACLAVTPELVESVERLRTYLPVSLDAGTGGGAAERRELDIPTRWLRGFLQVQSAATLPAATCELAPIDLYNLLYVLRMNKAKKSPRALRFELVPGLRPRLVVEPWETVLECHGPVFAGKTPRVVRTFGRQRLLSLARMLPHLQRVRVQLVGPGLPVFWILEGGGAVLTACLTGWTESGWSSAAAFDVLTPAPSARTLAERVGSLLRERGPLAIDALVAATSGQVEDVRAALQLECLRGRALFDLASNAFRPRALLAQAVDEEQIRYGSEREAQAHRLLEQQGVALTKVHELVGEGLEIHGEVNDREAHRAFAPSFTLDLEGRVAGAQCGCPAFKRAGLREGPCEHMIALRLAHARRRAEEEALRRTPEGRRLIRAETRTYVKREESGVELVYRVSLDDRAVHLRWGARSQITAEPREQRLWFDTDRDAREAYFARLDALAGDGFIDADASA